MPLDRPCLILGAVSQMVVKSGSRPQARLRKKGLDVPSGNGIGDARRVLEDIFLGPLHEHRIDHPDDFARIPVIEGAATVAREGCRIQLKDIEGRVGALDQRGGEVFCGGWRRIDGRDGCQACAVGGGVQAQDRADGVAGEVIEATFLRLAGVSELQWGQRLSLEPEDDQIVVRVGGDLLRLARSDAIGSRDQNRQGFPLFCLHDGRGHMGIGDDVVAIGHHEAGARQLYPGRAQGVDCPDADDGGFYGGQHVDDVGGGRVEKQAQ